MTVTTTPALGDEARFRAFISASFDAVYRMSPDWSEMRELEGRRFLRATEKPDASWLDLYIQPKDQQAVRAAINHAIETKSLFEMEHQVIRADGSVGWTASRAAPILDGDGEIQEWIGTASDVTERRLAIDALAASEDRLAFLLRLSDALRPLESSAEIQQIATSLLGEELGADRVGYAIDLGNGEIAVTHNYTRDGVGLEGRYRYEDYGEDLLMKLRGGQTVVRSDIANDPSLSDVEKISHAELHLGATVNVPLLGRGQLQAVLFLHYRSAHVFSLREVNFLAEAADRIWIAIERALALASVRANEERQAFLLELSDGLRPLGDPVEVQVFATRTLGLHLGASRALYIEVDTDGDRCMIHRDYVDGVPSMAGRQRLSDYETRATKNWLAGRVARYADVDGDQSLTLIQRKVAAVAQVRAWIGVPLLKGGRLGAILAIHQSTPRHWSDEDVELVRETAERTWAAVEQARAEAALRASEARLAAAFESVPVGAAVIDMSGAAVLSNSEYRRFLPQGVIPSRDPATFSRWRAWDSDGHPLTSNQFPGARALRGESVVPGQEMLYTDDEGREIWTTVATTPTLDERGQVTGVVTAISDVDIARRNVEALRFSEERLRKFGEASQDVLWIRDAKTFQWEYLTPAFQIIYGLDCEAALRGDNMTGWLELIVPEDREHAAASLSRVRDGQWVTFEFRIRRPVDGQLRWLRNTDFPIQSASGEVVRIGGIGHDITDLKRAEEALTSLEARQRTLMEGIPQLVWRSCDRGLWTWASPQWLNFTGQSQTRAQGLGWLDAVHPDDRATALAAWDEARPQGLLDVEYRVRRAADGNWIWHHTRSLPVRGSDGEIQEWLGTSTDIQDLRELQERQQVLVAELQHRTRNLMGVIRSISDKTADASVNWHDFRVRFRDRLDALARVQGLLSRLQEHDRVTFDELIETELAAMEGVANGVRLEGPRGVRLRSSIVQMLAMALHELATNAVKYGALSQPQGKLAVTWSLTRIQDDQSWLQIIWSEKGVKMPPAYSTQGGGGQGRELIERALPYQLSAKTTYELRPDGVHCTISIPISKTVFSQPSCHV